MLFSYSKFPNIAIVECSFTYRHKRTSLESLDKTVYS